MRWDEMLGKTKCWKQLSFCTHTFVHFMDLHENIKHIQMRQQMINTKLHILFQKLQILVNWMFVHKFWKFHKINHFGIVALWCHNLNNMTITLKLKKNKNKSSKSHCFVLPEATCGEDPCPSQHLPAFCSSIFPHPCFDCFI